MFSCCTRKDGSRYLHGPCGCPSATFTCESEEINPALCGYSEYSGFASSPPKKYLIETETLSNSAESYSCRFCGGDVQDYVSGLMSGSGVQTYTHTYNPDDNCSLETVVDGDGTYTLSGTIAACPEADPASVDRNIIAVPQTIESATRKAGYFDYTSPPDQCGNSTTDNKSTISELSSEDTEENAALRAVPVDSTSCSSLWEVRSTGFTWTIRTSEYTIECESLVKGLDYKVTPSIRRRTAVIGSYGSWEDVTVSPHLFTATDTTETIGPAALNHTQGYEYQITGVSIEKA